MYNESSFSKAGYTVSTYQGRDNKCMDYSSILVVGVLSPQGGCDRAHPSSTYRDDDDCGDRSVGGEQEN